MQSERLFRTILNSVADGVFTVDSDRRITSFNSAAEKITGFPARDAIGKKCYEVFHADHCERGCLLERTLKTGHEVVDKPVRILNRRGDSVPISISTSVLREDDGVILGAVETFRDLSAIEDLRKELNRTYSYEDIITKAPALLKIISILPDVAESDSTVLIEGPSGSGKEVFARAVHASSLRQDKPLVTINCGALPPQLVESELFGYKKGAFTDAKADKAGKVAAAEGGTLFLDEVGELPLSTQVKLLRLLQQREYEPVGGISPRKANIRIVAATNRNLRQAVDAGEFREDLYYRIAVIRFALPPLRDRREDIPLLTDHFVRRFNALKGKDILSVSPAYMEVLMRHDFPGNVRELENIIEFGFAICRGRTLDLAHLPVELSGDRDSSDPTSALRAAAAPGPRGSDGLSKVGDRAASPAATPAASEETGENSPRGTRLDALMHQLNHEHSTPVREAIIEEAAICEALRMQHGNRTRAAKALGIDRTTLWRKMKKFGIAPDDEGSRAEIRGG